MVFFSSNLYHRATVFKVKYFYTFFTAEFATISSFLITATKRDTVGLQAYIPKGIRTPSRVQHLAADSCDESQSFFIADLVYTR